MFEGFKRYDCVKLSFPRLCFERPLDERTGIVIAGGLYSVLGYVNTDRVEDLRPITYAGSCVEDSSLNLLGGKLVSSKMAPVDVSDWPSFQYASPLLITRSS